MMHDECSNTMISYEKPPQNRTLGDTPWKNSPRMAPLHMPGNQRACDAPTPILTTIPS
ncbi:hypothetical protein M378DRAFT_160493 [Amanita muscaria Koide BX008]|uniref:Uncharacterized protein n=1 Tax=Amanita muscaria (strain Koide BX008) TaxID=946122 RepID=A0A0C2SU69_AMAMK|nr:hypothetical protein M378DRAFT_160493 [Amanita muscaria Koide BX008]